MFPHALDSMGLIVLKKQVSQLIKKRQMMAIGNVIPKDYPSEFKKRGKF